MNRKILLSILLSCFFLMNAGAQNSYYWYREQQVPLIKNTEKYLVEFPSGLYQSIDEDSQATIGQYLFLNTFLVTDTTTLSNYATTHKVSPTYILSGGAELYYVSQIVFQFKANVSEPDKAALIAANGLTFMESSLSYDLYSVVGDALVAANNMFESGKVEYAHPDFVTVKTPAYYPSDPYFNLQWYLYNWGQTDHDGKSGIAGADINMMPAWDITTGDVNITIAVLDQGVTSNHPDLLDTCQKRYNGSNFASAYDGSGNPNNPSPTLNTKAGNNHGNACAGIIAAAHNNQGIAGIAPKCKIMPVKIPFDVPSVSHLFAAATDFANVNGAKIINMSYGSIVGSDVEDFAINRAIINNKVVVAATGNTANHAALFDVSGYVQHPGNSHVKGVITVGASDRYNKLATYSPYGDNIEIAAPSHTAYPHQITGETYNVWTIDIPDTFGYNPYRDTLKPVQLPAIGSILPYSGTNYYSYSGRFGGTSAAAPQVCGVVALMLSVNPCLSNFQILDILQSTSDKVGGYNYNVFPDKLGQSKELGHGKLNALKAVKAAQAAYATKDSDLVYIKDNPTDNGITGTLGTGGGDKSPDIWVRNSNDGLINQFHENPEFSLDSPCYVYVRVRNKSCNAYSPSTSTPPKIKLYWSRASTWSSWPSNWGAGSPFIGGAVDSLLMPVIPSGKDSIMTFKWRMISAFASKTTNACLMARIEGIEGFTTNPIKINAGRLDIDVKENNNIAMRNLTVVDVKPGIPKAIGGRVMVGSNENDVNTTFKLKVNVPNSDVVGHTIITDEAEVKLSFDSLGWSIMDASGAFNQQGLEIIGTNSVLVKSSNLSFNNIVFPNDTRIPIDFSFNFLIDQQTENLRYEYEISQAYADTPDMILGREHFEINKTIREPFNAFAGDDTTINKGDSIIIIASQIGDSAEYNWYDGANNLLYSGVNFKVSPSSNTSYKLEVVSLVDGFKDYDEVEVIVRQHFITSVSPNPATSNVTIGYDANGAGTASIMFVRSNGTTYSTHSLNVGQNQVALSVGSYPSGIYNVVLVCDGQVSDSRTLQIN